MSSDGLIFYSSSLSSIYSSILILWLIPNYNGLLLSTSSSSLSVYYVGFNIIMASSDPIEDVRELS